MQMNTQDYLKKTLIDTQERIRDFMNYSEKIESSQLKGFFQNYAASEGKQAQQLQDFIKKYEMK